MNWEPVYALLIMTSTALTYICGLLINKYRSVEKKRKLFLVIGLVLNFSILFFFKYYNFINETVYALLDSCNIRWNVPDFQMLLPVGISFYTFQAVGYTIDVYRGNLRPERNFIVYALFVSFFPQLVAGPIERAKNLLPQFYLKKNFNYDRFVRGLSQMVWGFFMKLCVADRVASYVDAVYNHVPNHTSTSLLFATCLFAFQIYCDFAGYSNIAIGAARIMGFDLMENFHRPYLASSVKDFWKRWHISLSTWFMDYVYIPLGGNRCVYIKHLRNLFITFLVSGIWHGANWTFVLWGGVHGFFLIVENILKRLKCDITTNLFGRFCSWCMVLVVVLFGWIFFRANTVEDAFDIIGKISGQWGGVLFKGAGIPNMILSLFCISVLLFKDLKDEFHWDMSFLSSSNVWVRNLSIAVMLMFILLSGVFDSNSFIYFQF